MTIKHWSLIDLMEIGAGLVGISQFPYRFTSFI
jgi:hypothetical protein